MASTSHAPRRPTPDDCCYLCLSGAEAGPLCIPCACPSLWSHTKCLARWQLQQAGKEEEVRCRFCRGALATWASSLEDPQEDPDVKAAVPIMALVYNGKMVKLPITPGPEGAEVLKRQPIPITPGPDGAEVLKRQIRRIFDLADDIELDVAFEVKVPTLVEDNSSRVFLKGFHAFEAASTVAKISASKRAAQESQQSQQRAGHDDAARPRRESPRSSRAFAADPSPSATSDAGNDGALESDSVEAPREAASDSPHAARWHVSAAVAGLRSWIQRGGLLARAGARIVR
ncbi:hypothetical protein FOA52_010813 [Chlamydomonas sp. UWO 241]|nr:hypothetical protein FOA52_010813 [Chlamydomonas sp. UWO 241]